MLIWTVMYLALLLTVSTFHNLKRFARACSHLDDFNERNICITNKVCIRATAIIN